MKLTREVEHWEGATAGIPPEDLNARPQQTQAFRMELLARQEKV